MPNLNSQQRKKGDLAWIRGWFFFFFSSRSLQSRVPVICRGALYKRKYDIQTIRQERSSMNERVKASLEAKWKSQLKVSKLPTTVAISKRQESRNALCRFMALLPLIYGCVSCAPSDCYQWTQRLWPQFTGQQLRQTVVSFSICARDLRTVSLPSLFIPLQQEILGWVSARWLLTYFCGRPWPRSTRPHLFSQQLQKNRVTLRLGARCSHMCLHDASVVFHDRRASNNKR